MSTDLKAHPAKLAGAVAAGGFAGGAARALFMLVEHSGQPYYTHGWEIHVPNALGCLIVGFLAITAEEMWLRHPLWSAFVMTGFFSSVTTFSALVGLYLPVEEGPGWMMARFVLVVVVSVSIMAIGMVIGNEWRKRRMSHD